MLDPGYADANAYGYLIRQRLQQDIKVTCGVGIGPTKTLSKFANHLAKKNAEFGGVFNTLDHTPEDMNRWMAAYPVSEVWGVGRQLTKRLCEDGIETALDLARCDAVSIRKRYGIVLEKLQIGI